MKRTCLVTTSLLLVVGATGVVASAVGRRAPLDFEELSMIFEINSTDADAEIVFEANSDVGIEQMAILDPNGQTIFTLTSSDPQGIGLSEVAIESAEPDIPSVVAAYPPGQYTVMGLTVTGEVLSGLVDLSHATTGRPTIVAPGPGDQIAYDDVVIRWEEVAGVDHYVLELEEDDVWELTVELPAGKKKFNVPSALLAPGTTYQVGIGAIAPNGNLIVTEVEFETLP